MSLQIWLPLNGSLENKGLLQVTPSGSCTYENGKTGKCVLSPASTAITISSSEINYSNFTVAFWVKCKSNYSGDWYKIVVLNTANPGNGTSGTLRFEHASGSGYARTLSSHNNASYDLDAGSTIYSTTANVWMHAVYEYDGSTGKIVSYLNGKKIDERRQKTGGRLNGGITIGYSYQGWICDFRLYDHCLSTAEVKEISKALVAHYKLSDQYETNIRNKYSGDVALGNLSAGSFTKTKLTDEIGYNYKLSYTGTGNNIWFSIDTGSTFSFTVGKKYFYSCKVRCHSSNFAFWLRASRSYNDWVTNMVNVLNADGQWHEYYVYQTINKTYDRSGSTVTCDPILEFYSESLATAGKVYSADFDIKDIQVVESDTYVPFIYNTFALSSISDCSGFGNNGAINGTFGFNQNSPRYGGCYKFTGINYIKTGFSSLMNKLSCSFWVKPNSQDGEYSIIASNYGDPSTGFWISVNCEKSGLWFFNGSYVKSAASSLSNDAWHHACFTYNNGIGKWYIDGNLDSTVDISSRGTSLYISNLTIGNSYTGSSWNTKFYGSISDFRVYSTCLSDAEVKSLYNVSASISNTGALMTYEFYEEGL